MSSEAWGRINDKENGERTGSRPGRRNSLHRALDAEECSLSEELRPRKKGSQLW